MERNIQLAIFYIVRHGETLWNKQGLLQGHSDSKLTKTGEKQARQIAQTLKSVHLDEVYSSDLIRARRTAEIIALERKIVIQTHTALRERFYGRFEGKPFQEINTERVKFLEKYRHLTVSQLDRQQFADTETIAQTVSRFITLLRELAIAYIGKTLLIVSHGGVMRYLLIHLGFGNHNTLPPGIISNTGYIKLASDGVDFFIKETQGIKKVKNSLS